MKTIYEHFYKFNSEDVNIAIYSLIDKEREIILLLYPTNGNDKDLSVKDLSKRFCTRYSKIKHQINAIEEKLEKKLLELNNIRIENNKTDEEIAEELISKIKNEIINNKIDSNRESIYNINSITVKLISNNYKCNLTQLKNGKLDTVHSKEKECTIFEINTYKNRIFKHSKIILKDIKTNQIYRVLRRDTNANFDLSSVNNEETVCTYINGYNNSYCLSKVRVKEGETKNHNKQENINSNIEIEVKDQYDEDLEKGKDLYFKKIEENSNMYDCEKRLKNALNSKKAKTKEEANLFLGKVYLFRKMADTSKKYIEDCLKLNPNNYDAHIEMSKIESLNKNYDKVLKELELCEKINPSRTEHSVERAKYYKKIDEIDEALKQINLAIMKNNDDYMLHSEKVQLLFELKLYRDALFEINKCEIIKNKYKLTYNTHKIVLAKINYLTKDKNKALKMFRDLIYEETSKHSFIINAQDIGYFFRTLGEKELTYHFFSLVPKFIEWSSSSREEISKHVMKHQNNYFNEKNHSIFNIEISLDLLEKIIEKMENPTCIGKMYDIYQLHCENIGYVTDSFNKTRQQNYIKIATLPFSKKIIFAHPCDLPRSKTIYSIDIENLKSSSDDSPIVLKLKKD